jgi:hypothetical protein
MKNRFAVTCIALAASALPAVSALAGAEEDLRRAAQLVRQGEAPAAVALWTRWAEQGNVDAAYNLAVVHQHGDGVPVDYVKAMHWYRFAAERGDRVAQYMVGQMYLEGQGMPADKAEAHRWFTAHRAHHAHHDHTPQMQAWRRQAMALIQECDRRESLAASRANDGQVLDELRRRAGIGATPPLADAAAVAPNKRRP